MLEIEFRNNTCTNISKNSSVVLVRTVTHRLYIVLNFPPPFGLFAFTLFLMMLSHTIGRWYLPSLLRLGFRVVMRMVSFTTLSNHLDAVVKISMFSYSTECWGCLMWICFVTSEMVELGLRCSLNLDFIDLSISLTCILLPHTLHT